MICPRYIEGPWAYSKDHHWREDNTCSYCGSFNPDELMKRLEAGDVEIGSTDKSYKIYLRNCGGATFKQTFRDCPRDATCTGPDDCTHWVTRDTPHSKFYFQHLSDQQQHRFVELYNEKKLKFEGGYSFYVLPFFMRRKEA